MKHESIKLVTFRTEESMEESKKILWLPAMRKKRGRRWSKNT